MVTTLILIVGEVLLVALAVIYFSLVRRRRPRTQEEGVSGAVGNDSHVRRARRPWSSLLTERQCGSSSIGRGRRGAGRTSGHAGGGTGRSSGQRVRNERINFPHQD